MKYFNHITTTEEIKKQFRAYCVSMHPDKGGDPEEFKTMMAEYNDIIKNFERAKEEARAEEEARKEAEEARKAEEERKRKEEEEERKAAEALREIIAKWEGKLKTVTPAAGWYEAPDASYLAAVKYNIKKMLNEYFPGVKFNISLRTKLWSASAEISWVDGPTVDEVEDVKELSFLFLIITFVTLTRIMDTTKRRRAPGHGVRSSGRFQMIALNLLALSRSSVKLKLWQRFTRFSHSLKG